jgi:hypothetical protein
VFVRLSRRFGYWVLVLDTVLGCGCPFRSRSADHMTRAQVTISRSIEKRYLQ